MKWIWFISVVLAIKFRYGRTKNLKLCRLEHARERKNFNDLGDKERTRLFAAINKLNRGPRPNKWDDFATIHVENFDLCHRTEMFLIWHRLFVFKFEEALREIDPTVSLPYWDWTVASQDPSKDRVFSRDNFGGNGIRGNSCVPDGVFKHFKVRGYDQVDGFRGEVCLKRNPDLSTKSFFSPELIEIGPLSKTSMFEFGLELEMGPHAIVHSGIGESFMDKASPSDPLFFVHHAFVDKLWFDWQKRNFKKPLPRSITQKLKLPPWNINPYQLIDTMSHLCYYYKQDTFSWDPTYKPYTRRSNSQEEPTADQILGDVKEELNNVTKAFAVSNAKKAKLVKDIVNALKALNTGAIAPTSKNKTDLCNLRIPDPPSEEFMDKMGYSESVRVRLMGDHRKRVAEISLLNTLDGFVSVSALVHTHNASISAADCTDPNFNKAKELFPNPKAKPITSL
ncbi:hypothetical protein L0F63_007257, partial [Massospora cicadina]